jgi:predicted Zn-dependent protease with MMP-like domain
LLKTTLTQTEDTFYLARYEWGFLMDIPRRDGSMDNSNGNNYPEEEELLFSARKAQSSRSFLVLVGSIITILLLGLFLNLPLDTSTRLLALLGIGALWLVGYILLDKRIANSASDIAASPAKTFMDIEEEQGSNTSENKGGDELLPHQEDEPAFRTSIQAESADDPDATKSEHELTNFERLVQEALDSIPDEFHEQMDNLVVIVEDEPDTTTLDQTGTQEGHTLLGLYHGVPLTSIGYQHALLPERITIYQRTIEQYCGGEPARIREQVRATVLHEVAHHFGIDHDEMPIWVK